MGKKKKIFLIIFAAIVVIVLIHIISAFTLDQSIEYKEISFSSAKIPEEMNGYKIAFISDTHEMDDRELEKIALELNKLKPDLLALGGDYSTDGSNPERVMKTLSKIKTKDGIYGVEGNHDRYMYLFEAMEKYFIHPLSNSGVRIRENFSMK